MITVIIPTYNRPENIAQILNESIQSYHGKIFHFEIHDSGTDHKTKEIVKSFLSKNSNLAYFDYNPNIEVDEKVSKAILNCRGSYFFLLGDGILVDFNRLEDILQKNKYENAVVIDVEREGRKGRLNQDSELKTNRIYISGDPVQYAKKYFSHLTLWGGSIVETNFFKKAFPKQMEKYFRDVFSWWFPCAIFEAADLSIKENIENLNFGVIYTDVITNLPKKRSWQSRYYETTFKVFNEDIQYLPSRYNSIKKDIIIFFRNDCLVSNSYLLQLRIDGVLTLQKTIQYKKQIQIVPHFYGKMIFLSLTPRFFIKIICRLRRRSKTRKLRF